MDGARAIEDYFAALRVKDRGRLEEMLHPALRHVSPYGEWTDRDRMLDAIWPALGPIWVEELEVVGEPPVCVACYRHGGASSARLAERFRFEGGRIVEIEVFLGVGALPEGASGPADGS